MSFWFVYHLSNIFFFFEEPFKNVRAILSPWASLVAQLVKNLPARQGLIPGLGRDPGEGNGNPLQYSFIIIIIFTIYLFGCAGS